MSSCDECGKEVDAIVLDRCSDCILEFCPECLDDGCCAECWDERRVEDEQELDGTTPSVGGGR